MSDTRTLRSLLAVGVSTAAIITIAMPAMAQTGGGANVIQELVVTAQKKEEALQNVPIAVSAFDQSALEKSKIDGGPNLVLAVPNVNFSKQNFSGYNFQIRGIGSKLFAASGDAGVGIHLNNAPLIANNLFETDFYDMERVEILRGPQGTLYGRNATGGVVNLITAKPKDIFEADAYAEYGNYDSTKLRGMVNLPLGQEFALRVAGEYLKRGGFGKNTFTGNDADDRDLYGTRVTLAWNPTDRFKAWLVWDHFKENDNRSRIGKQYCTKDAGPSSVGGVGFSSDPNMASIQRSFFNQGCLATSLYSPNVLGTVNSQATTGGLFGALVGFQTGDAYAGKMQDPNIRNIESTFDPLYRAKTDIYEFNAEFNVTPDLKLSWLSALTYYDLYTREDYNRYTPSTTFNTTPNPCNAFSTPCGGPLTPAAYAALYTQIFPGGVVNDPQNGALNRFATSDISPADTRQFSTELRLQSSFNGRWNFNVGGNLTRYSAAGDNYFVMFNTGVGFLQLQNALNTGNPNCTSGPACILIDPKKDPDRNGHSYFDLYNPYDLTSYAAFGELYYQMTDSFKWTLGLRYTVDSKDQENHAVSLGAPGSGLLPAPPGLPAVLHAKFKKPTGRFGFDWQPDLDFTDHTLVYAFYSRGYKAGGLNPAFSPGLGVVPTPATFQPEFINAYEVGTKNTLLNGTLQLNLTGFHYDYQGYQVSKIVNRNSINENINAKVDGAEFESIWQPLDGLRLNAQVGWLHTKIGNSQSIDIFNRTQGVPGLTLVKTSGGQDCVTTTQAAAGVLAASNGQVPGIPASPFTILGTCGLVSTTGAGANIGGGALSAGLDAFGAPVSEGVPANLKGNDLPNSPHWTVSVGAQYTWRLGDWDAVLRGDYYKQTTTYARIYNSTADRIKSWDNVNMTLTLSQKDWGVTVAGYVKNLTNEKAITDFYLTSDDSGLFRNVFFTDPRTYGVSISKHF